MFRERWITRLGAGALVAVAASCISPVDQPGSKVPANCQVEAPLVAPQKTDILFVIDNSGSMSEEQDGIAQELPAFVDALKKGAGAAHDFQVGVITTTVYQNASIGGGVVYTTFADQSGRLQAVPDVTADGGTAPGTEKVLRSDDPELVSKFARLVKQGTKGSGQETPFEAVRLAVATDLVTTAQAEGGNAGFLRDGARLLVVVVTDEDDCSEMKRPPTVVVGSQSGRDYCGEQSSQLSRVQEYVDVFRGLKDSTGAQKEVLWAAIAPVGIQNKEAQAINDNGVIRNVDCPTSFGPGIRHREMALQFDSTAENLTSVCSANYRDSLLAIAQIANSSQSLEVDNVPDPRLLKVEVTRADGTVQSCTVANGGITFEPPTDGRGGKIFFQGECPRRFSDTGLVVKMICAG